MGDRVGLAVAPGGEVAPHQLGVRALALDARDVVGLQRQPHRSFQIALEGQIDIAAVEHQRAVDGAALGEAHDDAARPVRQRTGPVGPATHTHRRGAVHIDVELGSGRRGNRHALGRAQHPGGRAHGFLQRAVRRHALERLGVLVGDHEDAGAGLEDRRRLRRVHQALDGAVDDEAGLAEGRNHGLKLADRLARPGRAHGHGMAVARGRQDHMEGTRAQPQQRQLGQMHVEGARLRLRQDRCRVAALHRAALHHLAEGVDPLSLDAIGEHAGASSARASRSDDSP